MRTVGRIGPTFDATSVWTRSRGTPAAVRARYRSLKVLVDTRVLYFFPRAGCRRGPEGPHYVPTSAVRQSGEREEDDRETSRLPIVERKECFTCWRKPAADWARPRSDG